MVARVCLVSGGTGGHLMPALVLARALRAHGHEPLLVTEGRRVEREFLEREHIRFDAGPDVRSEDSRELEAIGLRARQPSRLQLPLWLMRATLEARQLLRDRAIDSVVSTGGRACVPVGLAARSLGKPLFLLEQNAVTGRANRLLQRFATRTYLGLPNAAGRAHRSLLTGTPLRPQLHDVDRRRARAELGLRADQPVVLVMGGSQGARSLNEVAPKAMQGLGRPVQVLHLAGAAADADVRSRYGVDRGATTIVRSMTMDMATMLGAADLVLCRGGGSTVAELMAVGRPAILVPYPHHRDRQQLRNANVLAQQGAAVVIEERHLDAASLRATIQELLDDPARLQRMSAAARGLCAADPTAAILADMRQHGGLGEGASTPVRRAGQPDDPPGGGR